MYGENRKMKDVRDKVDHRFVPANAARLESRTLDATAITWMAYKAGLRTFIHSFLNVLAPVLDNTNTQQIC